MARAKLRTEALRDHVVDVAVATLAEHGAAGFTTRRIAEAASTSVPAVYELFGDKRGLLRAVFFEGFHRLARRFDEAVETDDPRVDLDRMIWIFQDFVHDNARLFELMFSHPFADFSPGPDEQRAGAAARTFVLRQVRRNIVAGHLAGDASDIAHVILALAQGLAAQEAAGWLGRSRAVVRRRWRLAFRTLLDGLAPPAAR